MSWPGSTQLNPFLTHSNSGLTQLSWEKQENGGWVEEELCWERAELGKNRAVGTYRCSRTPLRLMEILQLHLQGRQLLPCFPVSSGGQGCFDQGSQSLYVEVFVGFCVLFCKNPQPKKTKTHSLKKPKAGSPQLSLFPTQPSPNSALFSALAQLSPRPTRPCSSSTQPCFPSTQPSPNSAPSLLSPRFREKFGEKTKSHQSLEASVVSKYCGKIFGRTGLEIEKCEFRNYEKLFHTPLPK